MAHAFQEGARPIREPEIFKLKQLDFLQNLLATDKCALQLTLFLLLSSIRVVST